MNLEDGSYVAEIATSAVALTALIFAGVEIHLGRRARKQDRALEAVRRWSDHEFAQHAKDATTILRSAGWKGHVDNRTTAMILINFFESLAADDVARRADRRIVHENFGYLALYYRGLANDFIAMTRSEHTEGLVSKWDLMLARWDRRGLIAENAPWRPEKPPREEPVAAQSVPTAWLLTAFMLAIIIASIIVAAGR